MELRRSWEGRVCSREEGVAKDEGDAEKNEPREFGMGWWKIYNGMQGGGALLRVTRYAAILLPINIIILVILLNQEKELAS